MDTISSPCILVCSIDIKTGYCFGCGRTSQEIGQWLIYDHQERQTIIAQLAQRLETVERRPRRETRRRKLAGQRTTSPDLKASL